MQSLQVRMNFQSRSLVEKLGLAADSTAKATASRSNSLQNLSLLHFSISFVNSFFKTSTPLLPNLSRSSPFFLLRTF